MKGKHALTLVDVIMIALFAALCYLMLMVLFIPVGPMFFHVGNLIVVTAALLIGGFKGGLAGAVGMGLFDLLNGHADSAPKTLVLKLLIGLTVGAVFSLYQKYEKGFPRKTLAAIAAVFLILCGGLLLFSLAWYERLTFTCGVLAAVCGVLFLLFLVFALLGKRLPARAAWAYIAACAGMAVNLLGETLYKFVYYLMLGNSVPAAGTLAVLEQSSTLINALVAVIGGVALYLAVCRPYAALRRSFGRESV